MAGLSFNRFYNLVIRIWTEGEVPKDLRDAKIVTIFKKGDVSDCGNFRGIALLSITGKVIAKVILSRLMRHVTERTLLEAQCGFRPGRSTMDMVFSLRQIQERCIEHTSPSTYCSST